MRVAIHEESPKNPRLASGGCIDHDNSERSRCALGAMHGGEEYQEDSCKDRVACPDS